MSRILIDLDGPVANYIDGFRLCVAEQQNISPEYAWASMPAAEDWHFFLKWNMSPESFAEAMRYAIKYQDLFNRLEPSEGALEGLHALADAGHDLVVVSARKWGPDTEAWAYYQTLTWLERHKAPPMEVVLTNYGEKKSEVANRLELEVGLEDSTESYLDLARAECYMEVKLLDRPWNREDKTADINEDRVYSWAEFVAGVR